MLMMKATKKRTKKSVVNVEAVAPAAAQPVCVKPEPPQAPKVALELVEPAAKQVFVAGSFNDWKPETTPLVRLGDGRWKGDLRLGPGRHEYLFVVDGQWRPDPNARETVQNPFGGQNSVIQVSA
jgi:1,4-alpha-glucan branching enzyme